MKLLVNSCVLDEIKEAASWGILGGVTMNPSMVAALKTDYVKNLRRICDAVDAPVFAQVVSTTPESILEEGKALAAIDKKVVVKVHTNLDGIRGMKLLVAADVPVCATAIHSVIESVVAAQAGAQHAAVFAGLLAEVDENSSVELLERIRAAYDKMGTQTKLLVAARSINQIVEATMIGVDEITCPFKLWAEFLNNAHTRKRWDAFIGDWTAAYGTRNWISG